ncbi:kallikrein-4 [Fukomys damarensis]|uniref:kallikrein-4 n=1 Tax=Fukomys damarensis TaxID=885580 RepID=UPI00053FC9CD|nr:kallikrein-4 [Fukomys damarensis]
MMVTARNPWGWLLGYLVLGVPAAAEGAAKRELGFREWAFAEDLYPLSGAPPWDPREPCVCASRDANLKPWPRPMTTPTATCIVNLSLAVATPLAPQSCPQSLATPLNPTPRAVRREPAEAQPSVAPHPPAPSSYSVGLGLHNLDASQEPGSRVLEPLLSIRHPEYDHPSFANDLMLIKLKEAVPESSTIRSISVASRCPVEGDACLVSGWGRLCPGGLPSRLQCVNISVAPQEVCSEVYDSVYHYSMFCAGGGPNRRDSCHGDSGGPLVCNRSLQGLVSLGHIPCGQPGSPSVYTNLCKFTDWIQQTISTS